MRISISITTDKDKLKFLYRAVELLRLEHNAKGKDFREGRMPEKDFRDYQKNDFDGRLKNVLHEINKIKEAEGITRSVLDEKGLPIETEKQKEFGELQESGKVETKWDTEIDIKIIEKAGRGIKVFDPTEDLTTYTEDDPLTKITVDANTVSWNDLKRGADSRVYKDFTAGYFSEDFEHLEDVRLSAVNDYGRPIPWRLANAVNNTPFNNAVTLFVVNYGYYDRFELVEGTGSAAYAANGATNGWALNTTYYLKIVRDESVETYGTSYCYVYTDSGRTTLQETLSLALHVKTDFRYLYAFSTYNDGGNYTSTGWVENLDLQEAVATNFQVNIGDIFKTVSAVQVNVGDTFKSVTKAQVNISGTWRTIF